MKENILKNSLCMSHELPKSLIGCPKSKKMRCGIAPEVPKIYNRVGMPAKKT